MRGIQIFQKFFTVMISLTLIHMPLAYAEEDAGNQNPTPTPTQEMSDANWCLESKASEVKSCKEDGLSYNCHLQVCAQESDNKLYNEEYSECNARPIDQRDECRENLKSLGTDLINHNEMVKNESSPDAGSDGMGSTVAAGAGAASTAAMGCGAFGVECPSGIGAALLGVVTLAIAFMAMQAKQYEDQFEAAAEMFKAEDENTKAGWNINTQRIAFEKQIQAFDMIAKAAAEKAKHHNMVAMLATIVAVIAGVMASSIIGNVDVCAIPTAVAGGIVAILEFTAAQHAKGVESDAKDAKSKVEKLLAKFDGLYNQNQISHSVGTDTVATATPRSSAGNLSNSSSSQDVGQSDNNFNKNSQCVSSDNSVGGCPCVGNSCYDFDFSVPNNSMGTTVDSALGFEKWETAADQAASGNTSQLDSLSNGANSALAKKIAKRTNSYLLKKKGKDMKKSDKDMLKALINPNTKKNSRLIANYAAQRFSPVRAAALISKNGIDNFGAKPDNKTARSAGSYKPYRAGTLSSSSIEDRLKALQDLADEQGFGTESHVFGSNSHNGEAGEAQAANLDENGNPQDLNPNRKISIFKVISNRYNVLRVKKRLP